MEEQDRRLSADEAYEERWMTRYGFVPHPIHHCHLIEKFWQHEAELLEWRKALAWKNLMAAAVAAMRDDQRNSLPT